MIWVELAGIWWGIIVFGSFFFFFLTFYSKLPIKASGLGDYFFSLVITPYRWQIGHPHTPARTTLHLRTTEEKLAFQNKRKKDDRCPCNKVYYWNICYHTKYWAGASQITIRPKLEVKQKLSFHPQFWLLCFVARANWGFTWLSSFKWETFKRVFDNALILCLVSFLPSGY